MTERTCIFILGMHRSGTSALTGVLELLGVELGSELMQPWEDNPKGFFENNKVWKHNQKILESFNSSWDDPFLYGHDWCDKHDLTPYRKHIAALLHDEFSTSKLFAIKDPRMCILFPFWRVILEEHNIRPVCLLPVRHPMEVSQSLAKRNNHSVEKGLLLWMNYVLTAEKVSRSCERIYLKFNDLFSSPDAVIEMVKSKLNISFQKSFEEVKGQIDIFLDRGLKHNDVSTSEYSIIEPKVQELYDCCCEVVGKYTTIAWEKKIDNIEAEYLQKHSFFLNKDLQRFAACPFELEKAREKIKFLETCINRITEQSDQLYAQIPALQSTNDSLQREIKMMSKTKAWRLAELFRRLQLKKSDKGQ